MIVKNEAENLAPCINPLKPVVDEIIVVDTGSTDNTKEIAEQLGAKVFDFPWCDDCSAARNESIRHATGDYILWLDADDRVDESEVQKIGLLKRRFPFKKDEAYYGIVNTQSPIEGDCLYYQMRIFPRVKGVLFEGKVHEQIFHNLGRMGIKLVQTDLVIMHTGYHDDGAVITKLERNLRIIEEELKSDPDNFLLHFNAARTLGINRQAEAIDHIKRITENDTIRNNNKPLFLQASLLLGKYHTDLKLYNEAISIYKNLSRDFEKIGMVHYLFGQLLFWAGDYKEAIEELRKSLIFPIQVDFLPVNLSQVCYYQYYFLGQCYLETGEADLAKEMFIKSLNHYKDHIKSLEALGLLSLKENKFKEAVEYYERAIQEGGASDDSNYANLGLAYRKLGLWIEAEKSLVKALEINPQRIEALTNLGHLYHKKKEVPKAVDCFIKALDLDPNLKDVRLALSDIYFRLSDIENLVGQCDALLKELNLPRNFVIESFNELSVLYERIGETLSKNGLSNLSLMAYHVSFMIHPSRGVLDKILPVAKISKVLESSREKIHEALVFHKRQGQDVAIEFDSPTPTLRP
jgi:tetratricopeptide (TPR) repeat protein